MKSVLWSKKISNKAVLAFMLKQEQPYWTVYKYRGKHYIMSFQYNIYRVDV